MESGESDNVRYEGRQAAILPPVAQAKIGHTCRNIQHRVLIIYASTLILRAYFNVFENKTNWIPI